MGGLCTASGVTPSCRPRWRTACAVAHTVDIVPRDEHPAGRYVDFGANNLTATAYDRMSVFASAINSVPGWWLWLGGDGDVDVHQKSTYIHAIAMMEHSSSLYFWGLSSWTSVCVGWGISGLVG